MLNMIAVDASTEDGWVCKLEVRAVSMQAVKDALADAQVPYDVYTVWLEDTAHPVLTVEFTEKDQADYEARAGA